MTSPSFAAVAPESKPTPLADVDALVARLRAHKDAWVRTPLARREELLRRCIQRTVAVSRDWVAMACRAKGLDAMTPQAGEEWLAGPMCVVRNLRLLADAMKHGGAAPIPKTFERPDGQRVARVFPVSTLDELMFAGITAEVWAEPGQALSQGRAYRDKARGAVPDGKVALVLGAGNVASIGPMDALYKLFVDDEVVVVKTNPVNAYLQPFWEEAFRPLLDEGVFGVVRGGVEVGAHLTAHPDVDTIHITGSNRTYDAIVWGADAEEQARRKASGERANPKPITSGLGAVTPVLVVPGEWSDAELEYQARHVAGMVANNASFNCNAAKILVTAEGWPQRERFLERVEHHLEQASPRRAYYPGAQERYDGFLERYPSARPLGPRSDAIVPWTILPDVPPIEGEYALTNEAFCGVLAETRLPVSDAADFLEQVVVFANDRCWGTLSCVVLIDPKTQRAHEDAFERALGELRYGGIGVNAFAGVIYALVSPTWGAFPGHTDEDIRSGRGVVHNTFLIDHPQKSVVRAPFRIKPTPAWFADHKTGHELGPALVRIEADPSLRRLPVIFAALRG